MKNKIIIFVTIIVFVLVVLLFADNHNKPLDSNGIEWNGNQDISSYKEEIKYISIPRFNKMYFNQSKNQKVNFYNPKENTCTMTMELYLNDGSLLWSADNVKPGYGFYDIEIMKPLLKGVYENCHYIVHCYNDNGTELNGGDIKFVLFVN